MGYVIAIIVAVAVVAVAAGLVVGLRRRRDAGRAVAAPPVPAAPRTPRPEPTPMHGLEDALAAATDRSGKTMAERLDDESEIVEGLRVTDDTGPLLRRALDHVRPDDTAGRTGDDSSSEA